MRGRSIVEYRDDSRPIVLNNGTHDFRLSGAAHRITAADPQCIGLWPCVNVSVALAALQCAR